MKLSLIQYLSICAQGNIQRLSAVTAFVDNKDPAILEEILDNDLDTRFWLMECFERIKDVHTTPKQFEPKFEDYLAGYSSGKSRLKYLDALLS